MSWIVALIACGIALACALLAVTRARIVHALILLVATLLAIAGAFFALGATFAGAVQILIYAGAITAVFVFVVMTVDTTPGGVAGERGRFAAAWPIPGMLAIVLLTPFVLGLRHGSFEAPGPGGLQALGALLFGPWALAVELASFLLLAALLGARHLGRRAPPERE